MNENYLRISGELTEDATQRGDNGPLVLNLRHSGPEFERRDGTMGQNKLYINAVCWRDLKQEWAHLQEGAQVTAEGFLEFNSYVNKDGEKKGSMQLVVSHVTQDGDGASEPAQQELATSPAPVTDDDIPF
jgi:single-stranded DNA-binding protein